MNAEQLEDETQLPTLAFAATIQIECRNDVCEEEALILQAYCGHRLNVAHQMTPPYGALQIVLWHGGEAMFTMNTHMGTLLSVHRTSVEWIDAVHAYLSEQDAAPAD